MDDTSLENKYDLISGVCRIANSSPNLSERLQMVVDLVSQKMKTGVCSVYLMDENSRLVLKAAKGLSSDAVNQVSLKKDEGITGMAASEKRTIAVSEARSHPRFVNIPITGEDRFRSIISTPIMSGGDDIGVLNVQTEEKRDFSRAEIKTMEILAEQLAGIIKNSNLYEKNAANLRNLTIIHEMGKRINSSLKLPELMKAILECGCEIIQSECSALWLKEKDGSLSKRCSLGPGSDDLMVHNFIVSDRRNGCAGQECVIKMSSLFQNYPEKEIKISCSLDHDVREKYLCLPLLSQSKLIGMLSVHRNRKHSSIAHFSKTEKKLFALLANQAALAIDDALTHQRLENLNKKNMGHLRELGILYDTAQAMGTNMDLDKCLRVILNAVTVGDGLGFNRAILFLLSDDGTLLQGMMGVGPDSAQEAGKIWNRLSGQETSNLYEWLVQCTEEIGKKSLFDKLAKSIRVPMKHPQCILARTVTEKRSFNIKDAKNNPFVDKTMLGKLGCDSFSTVPLMAHDKVLGVIFVDNLFTGAPITEADLQFLAHFAGQAGRTIQNSAMFTRLAIVNRELIWARKRLSESEHFAALGELSAEIAHEIKNPLVPIGGFARRLFNKLKDDSPEKKYSRIIVDEVSRLEKLLNNVLNYSKKIEPQFSMGNINAVIEDVLNLLKDDLEESRIRLTCRFNENIQECSFDPNQIKQVIGNLLSNSIQCMAESGGELAIATERGEDGDIILKVEDNGGGMPEDVAKNIFNPFFTTKDSGTGIGLCLVKKIVENHNGRIGVENIVGTGVKLTIILPRYPVADPKGK